VEGQFPGECEDGADNDTDGDFDCDDSDCVGAPVCQGASEGCDCAAGGRTGTTSPGLLLLMLVVIGFCRRRSR